MKGPSSVIPIRAEMLSLEQVVKLPRNAKGHDPESITASLRRFGYLQRIIINETTGHLLSGHGRIEVLQKMQQHGESPPIGIEETAAGWAVPVDYVSVPEAEEEAAALALNKAQENGGWDDPILDEVLAQLREADALMGTGFSEDEVDARLLKPHLKKVPIEQPPPDMVWVLVGIPMARYGEVTAQIEAALSAPPPRKNWLWRLFFG